MKYKYTNLEKIKFLMDYNKETQMINKYMYIMSPRNSKYTFTKMAETLFGNEKIANLLDETIEYEDDKKNFYNDIAAFKDYFNKDFIGEIKDLLKNIKVKHENILKKRLKKMRMIILINQKEKRNLYEQFYSDRYASYTFEDFRNVYQSEDSKVLLAERFLKYISNTEINKRKQSKMYSVSRDMDKDAYYITNEERLAKIKKWLLLKYMKKGIIDKNYRANKAIDEGIIIKPMKLINKVIPKANENMKLMIASLFEGIKECKMVIDTDFKKAYDPYYQNHQDTDGDKASNYSCMSGEGDRAQEFYGKIHGCKVVRWETEDGDQVGRCIMYEWNNRRHFIRIYGLYPYHRTMINMLEAQMKEGDLFGRNCALENICLDTDMDWDTEVMYLDGQRYGIKEEDGQFYMVADKYDLDCKETGGNSIEDILDDTSVCEHCGHRISNDEGIWIDDYFYCDSECANNDGYYSCERCGEWKHKDDMICIDNNYYCCEECARRAGYEYDNYYDEWTDEDDLGETDDGEYKTTKDGAAEYYGVDEDEVKWDCDNCCWKRPAQVEDEQNEQKQNEIKGENND